MTIQYTKKEIYSFTTALCSQPQNFKIPVNKGKIYYYTKEINLRNQRKVEALIANGHHVEVITDESKLKGLSIHQIIIDDPISKEAAAEILM